MRTQDWRLTHVRISSASLAPYWAAMALLATEIAIIAGGLVMFA